MRMINYFLSFNLTILLFTIYFIRILLSLFVNLIFPPILTFTGICNFIFGLLLFIFYIFILFFIKFIISLANNKELKKSNSGLA